VLFALAEPHDEIVVREKGVFVEGKDGKPVGAVQRETTTAKDVVSVQALLKLLQAYKPEKYGKKVGVDVGFTFADLAAMAQSDEDS
jgi:hypothetical protein